MLMVSFRGGLPHAFLGAYPAGQFISNNSPMIDFVRRLREDLLPEYLKTLSATRSELNSPQCAQGSNECNLIMLGALHRASPHAGKSFRA